MSTSFLGSPSHFGQPKRLGAVQLQEVFEDRADLYPDRIAVEYADSHLTYR